MLNRRIFLVGSASALGLSVIVPQPASAAVGAWAQDEGGSRDLQTGLVWLDHKLLTLAEPTFAEAFTLADALDHQGYSDWRVPTLNEMTAAVDHGLPQNCPMWPSATGGGAFLYWSSTKDGPKYAYGVDMLTGVSHRVHTGPTQIPGGGKRYSHLFCMFVRQGTL